MSKTTQSNVINWRTLTNLFAYIAIVMIGVSLILTRIFSSSGQLVVALNQISNIIAQVVVAITSFSYAKYKRNIWFFLVWLLAMVLIFIYYFL